MKTPHWNDAVEAIWEIRETPPDYRELVKTSFMVVRTGPTGHEAWFPAANLDDAKQMLLHAGQEEERNRIVHVV